MKLSWKRFRKNIPMSVKILKAAYEILWQDEEISGTNAGETRFDVKQIVLHNIKDSKELTHTYFHEVLHAISFEYDANLTETQVIKLEKALPDFIKIIRGLDRGDKK